MIHFSFLQINAFTCECNVGYEGVLCEIDIDECERYTPCINGKCVDGIGSYKCFCEPNYGGKNCSVIQIKFLLIFCFKFHGNQFVM